MENENVVDENVDPNVPEPLDCLETGHVSMTSDDDWVPDEDAIGHMSTEDEIDDSQDEEEEEEANLLPQEHRQRRVNRRCAVALVDAVNVEYLDHGSRSKRCEVCHAPLYEWEVKKRKNEPTTGGPSAATMGKLLSSLTTLTGHLRSHRGPCGTISRPARGNCSTAIFGTSIQRFRWHQAPLMWFTSQE